jgi:hypothetical protein
MAETGFTIKKEKYKVVAKLPFQFITWQNPRKMLFLPQPQLYAVYDFSAKWQADLRCGLSSTFGEIEDVFGGYILQNYRTLSRNAGVITQSQSQLVNVSVRYKDLLKFWLANINLGYVPNQKNTLSSQSYEDIVVNSSTILFENRSKSINFHADLSKYIFDIRTRFSLAFDNSKTQSNKFLGDNTNPIRIDIDSKNLAFGIETKPLTWLNSQLELKYSNYSSQINSLSSQKNRASIWNNSLIVNIFPSKRIITSYDFRHIVLIDNNKQSVSRSYSDIWLGYKFQKPKIDLSIIAQNIGNEQFYRTISFFENSAITSEVQLRPISLLAKISFSF